MIGRTPLCFGFLTGCYSLDDVFDISDHRSQWSREQVECWINAFRLFSNDLIKQKKKSHAQIALSFCLSYPGLSTTIPGMLTEAHVEENVKSSELGELDNSVIKHFNKIYHNNEFFIKP
jgi:aryl-alcohol dehydrogenase-like predicted oxidoreductase